MNRTLISFFTMTLATAAVSGCSHDPSAAIETKPERAAPNIADSIAAIRSAGAKFDSSVEVHPLRDPAVEGILKQARALDERAQAATALEFVHKALAIAKDAPDILQFQAELMIETGDWKNAASIAQKSYELGPKVGALCARNLQTLIESRTALADDPGAQAARQQLPSCRVPTPARY